MELAASPDFRQTELREFLRARRRSLIPLSLGLPDRRRWKHPGLRLAEVAELAQVSTSWYASFESGSAANVSPRTLTAIATALNLDEPETAYLFRLTGTPQPQQPAQSADEISPTLRKLVETYGDGIAMLLDFRYDIVTANGIAIQLGFAGTGPAFENNLFWRSFLMPEILRLSGPWRDVQGPPLVAILRRLYAESAGDTRLEALIQELKSGSAQFAALWEAHGVASSNSRRLNFMLPNDVEIRVETVILAAEGGLRICYFIPVDERSRLALYAYRAARD